MEQVLEVLYIDLAVLVGVNDLESFPDIVFPDKCFAIEAGSHEILEINLSITVDVAFFNDLGPFHLILLLVLPSKLRLGYSLDILHAQSAFVIAVQSYKCLLEFAKLLLGNAEA